jgi:iron complex outermembrane receptor protein
MNKLRVKISRTITPFVTSLMMSGVATSASAAAELEEILVTAQKREVSLQDAALAISIFSGEEFEKSNIMRLDNFNGYVPGLVVAKNDGAGRVVSIRGVGWETAQNIASQPSVLTYIDGIYLANPLAAGLDLGELERIDVYRGPQGTEFGQGTTGGSINLVTKKPDFEGVNGYLEGGSGTYNMAKLSGAINVPLSDTVAMRASIQQYTRDGFAVIRGGALDGYQLDDADSVSGKFGILWEPTENLSILAQVFHQTSDQNAAAQKSVIDPNPNIRELTQDFPGFFRLDNTSTNLTIEYETASGIVLKSQSGWQKLEKEQSVDGDRLTEDTISRDTSGFGRANNWDVLSFWDNDSSSFSQEFNASYSSEKLDWVGGIFYLKHDNTNDFLEATGASPFSDSIAALANPSAETLPPFNSVLLFNEIRTVAREDTAIYGQATYHLNETISLTGGLRYQKEDQRDFGQQFFGIFGGFDKDTNATNVTWKVGVDVNVTDNSMVYGLASTGWKNGGINPGAITNGAVILGGTFAPEEVTAFEVGSRNTFLGQRLRLNVTAFYYDHQNLQFAYEDPTPFGGGTGVIPNVEEYGVETEFGFQFNDAWRLDGAFSLQDGEAKSDVFALDVADFREALLPPTFSPEFTPGLGLFTPAGFDKRLELANSTNLKGNRPPKMPDVIARLSLSNAHTFASSAALSSRLEYVHRGEMQARVFNNPLVDTIPAYDVVNLNFTYNAANMPLTVSLSVTNLFDEEGINNMFTNPFGLWTTSAEYIPPQEVILSARYSW